MPIALVTGAARPNSIAAGIVPRLRADGWTVITSDLHEADIPCDLSQPDEPERLIREAAALYGPIEALILSHAHDVPTGVLDTTPESFDMHVAVNTRASLLLIAAFVAFLVSPEGRWVSGQLLQADGGFSARF